MPSRECRWCPARRKPTRLARTFARPPLALALARLALTLARLALARLALARLARGVKLPLLGLVRPESRSECSDSSIE